MLSVFVWCCLLFSCAISEPATAPESGKGETNMLTNTFSVEAKNLYIPDVWTIQKQIRRIDIIRVIAEYLQQGYEIVDAPSTAATIDLTSYTISSKKALVVWRDAPSGYITVDVTHTMNDSTGPLDQVVILGVQLDAYNQPENPSFYSTPISIYLTGDAVGLNYGGKLTFKYMNMYLASSVTYYKFRGVNFNDNLILIHAAYLTFYSCNFYGNKITLYNTTGEVLIYSWYSDIEILDNHFTHINAYQQSLGIKSANGYKVTLKNDYFYGIGLGSGRVGLESFSTSSDIVNMTNVLLEDCRGGYGNCYSDAINYIFVKNSSLTSGVTHKNVLVQWTGDISQGQIFTGKNVLDTDIITDDTDNLPMDARITPDIDNIDGTTSYVKRMYYSLQFQPEYEMDRELKYFDKLSLFRIKRTELMDIFVNDTNGARKIKNLQFLEYDGATLYTFRDDENFMLHATASGVEAWFAWYKGQLRTTSLGDVWPDTVYTIDYVFQLWKPPARFSWQNAMPYSNSGINANGQFQEMTSIFVIP